MGQTKGNLVQVDLLTNTDLRSSEEFKDLIVADRKGAVVRLRDVATVELGAEEATTVAKCKLDIEAFGGTYFDSEVVVSGNLVTARTWHDSPAWMREYIRLLHANT